MNAESARQLRLLDLQAIDTRLDQIRHARTHLPQLAEVAGPRATVVQEVGDDLVALYEKVRTANGGIGAAALRQRRCGGCQLELNPVEIQRLRLAPEDEVLRCEECRRILVRTPESGL